MPFAMMVLTLLVGFAPQSAVIAPAPRACFGGAYSDAHGVLVFGGARSCGLAPLDDVNLWAWNGERWRVAATVPAAVGPREDVLLVWDARRRVLVLHGGRRAGQVWRDTWEWDGKTWTERTTATGPPPLEHAAAAFDADRGRVVVFGGSQRGRPAPFDTTWEWDGTAWHDRSADGPRPAARVGHAMTWSPVLRGVVLYGGFNTSGSRRDLWLWNGTTWRVVDERGPADTEGALVAAGDQSVMIVGRANERDPAARVFQFRGSAWTAAGPAGPPLLVGQSAIFDASRRRLVVFGGHQPDRSAADASVWEFDGSAWHRR